MPPARPCPRLPELKSEYDAQLLAAGIEVNDAGYLPYAIMDGFQQLARDFATWRVLNAAEARERDPAKKAWYRAGPERREALVLRDIGYLSHYVGDGAQPHHMSIHYNGWGDYPNPEGFTNSRQTHGAFEGAFIRRTARLDAVEAVMPAPNLDGFELRARTASLSEHHTGPGHSLLSAGKGRWVPRRGRARCRVRHGASGRRRGGAARPDHPGLAGGWKPVDRLAGGQGRRSRSRHGRPLACHDRRGLSPRA